MKYMVSDVTWQTDGADVELPTELTVEAETADDIPDKLSDETGFLVESFTYRNA